MIIHLKFVIFATILIWIQTVESLSYYVTKSGKDSNVGTSQATAWLTIQKAANSATPGSTVYIGPGIYGEIAVSYASNNVVLRNIVKPNEQNIILAVDQKGGLNNTFDYQMYYPYGKNATQSKLIFYWGKKTYVGLSAFQQGTKQEMHAQVNAG